MAPQPSQFTTAEDLDNKDYLPIPTRDTAYMKSELGYVPDDLKRFKSMHTGFQGILDPTAKQTSKDLVLEFKGNTPMKIDHKTKYTNYTVEEQLLIFTKLPHKTPSQIGPSSKALLDKLKAGSFQRSLNAAALTQIMANYANTLECFQHAMRINHYLFHLFYHTNQPKCFLERVNTFKKGHEHVRTFSDVVQSDTMLQINSTSCLKLATKEDKEKVIEKFTENQQLFPLTLPKGTGTSRTARTIDPLTQEKLFPLYKKGLSNAGTLNSSQTDELKTLKQALKKGLPFFETNTGKAIFAKYQWSKKWFNPNKRPRDENPTRPSKRNRGGPRPRFPRNGRPYNNYIDNRQPPPNTQGQRGRGNRGGRGRGRNRGNRGRGRRFY